MNKYYYVEAENGRFATPAEAAEAFLQAIPHIYRLSGDLQAHLGLDDDEDVAWADVLDGVASTPVERYLDEAVWAYPPCPEGATVQEASAWLDQALTDILRSWSYQDRAGNWYGPGRYGYPVVDEEAE